MLIRAAVVAEPSGPFVLQQLRLEKPKAGEVLVKVAACGLCHTDLAARSGFMETPFPMVLGHEGSGVVVEAGPGTAVRLGQRVGFSYGWCGECPACREGQPYGCEKNRELNFSGRCYDGGHRLSLDGQDVSTFFGQSAFAEYAVVHENNLYPVPEDLPLKLAAPLGCGIQTGAGAVLNYLRPRPGSSLVVAGCGIVGLSALMAAVSAGCGTVICVDRNPARLELAKALGAAHTLQPEGSSLPRAVRELLGGRGADYAIDCTGSGASVRASLGSIRSLGICVVLGATGEVSFHCEQELMGPGRTLAGLVEGCSVPREFLPRLLELWRQGDFPFDRLLEFYPFADIARAAEDAAEGRVLKAVLVMDETLK